MYNTLVNVKLDYFTYSYLYMGNTNYILHSDISIRYDIIYMHVWGKNLWDLTTNPLIWIWKSYPVQVFNLKVVTIYR